MERRTDRAREEMMSPSTVTIVAIVITTPLLLRAAT
jgi:hypothetical protein